MNKPQDCVANESEYDDDKRYRDNRDSEGEKVEVTIMCGGLVFRLHDL